MSIFLILAILLIYKNIDFNLVFFLLNYTYVMQHNELRIVK